MCHHDSFRRERGAKALEERLGLKSTVAVMEQESARAPDLELGAGAGPSAHADLLPT